MSEQERTLTASDFMGPEAPSEQDLYKCVHCGLCLNVCPTYLETGLETESPRGRIYLMRAAHEGRIGITEAVNSHWSLCLECRACEVACPSGVPYGHMMELTRTQALRKQPGSWRARLFRWVAFRQLLPHQGRLVFLATLARFYQRLGLKSLVSGARVLRLLPGNVAMLHDTQPAIPRRIFGPSPNVHPAEGARRGRVALLSGCIMPLVYTEAMNATVRVLQRNGYDVVVPMGQGCCGALNAHAGVRDQAREMAKRNIDTFLAHEPDAIIVNSAGCGSTMKEYHYLVDNDPEYAGKAERFTALVKDVNEFLAVLPFEEGLGEVNARVTYQDPCHLAHAQRISKAPRELLKAIPGVEMVEMEEASVCCGAAGSYTVTQRAFSERLMKRKTAHLAEVGADVIATANPGCLIQLQTALNTAGLPGRVCHVVELLDEAYQAKAAEAGSRT